MKTLKEKQEEWYKIGSMCPMCKGERDICKSYCRKCFNIYMKMYRYNLTKNEHDNLDFSKCEICGSNEDIVIDHNHKTKKFRGILCKKCNIAIGMLKEDIDIINNLIKYLIKNK